jgi:dTDP-4-dehydrorhamnose reductase
VTRLLITGGTGYLGGELLRQAAAAGHAPAGGADIRDAAAVEALLAELRPELVIHTAFRQGGPELQATTAAGAGHVARASAGVGARLVHLSSDVIFDGEREGPYSEADTPTPISDYGAAKAAAEAMVAAAHPGAAIVRTSLIYGFAPIDRQTQFVLDVAAGRRDDRLFVDEFRCPIFVGDLAAALLELAALPYAGVLNIAGAERVSRYELGLLMARACGVDPAGIRGARSAESPVRRPRNCALAIGCAQGLLATPLRGVRQVLADLGRLAE